MDNVQIETIIARVTSHAHKAPMDVLVVSPGEIEGRDFDWENWLLQWYTTVEVDTSTWSLFTSRQTLEEHIAVCRAQGMGIARFRYQKDKA